MHVPPWQQPVRQLRKLQLPPPPDEPDELPDEPDELPLEDPLDEPLALPHDPPWQVWCDEVQSLHVAPCTPQAESSVPGLQAPLLSQHPLVHDAAQPLAALSVAPLGPEPSSPEDAPLSVPSPPVGVFRPGPVLVGAGAASSTAAPASCTGPRVIRMESSAVVPLPPVAHAAKAVRTNQPNPHLFGFDEPMRRPPAPSRHASLDQSRLRHQALRTTGVSDCVHAIPLRSHSPKRRCARHPRECL
jgi:hypothetical protein